MNNTKEDFRAYGVVAKGTVKIEVTSFDNNMCVIGENMPIMITKAQAAKFFGLIDPECERRKIAAQAMQGMLSNDHSNDWSMQEVCADSVSYADALLAALEAGQ